MSKEDEEHVKRKLHERSEAKLARDYDKADDTLDELKFLKNACANDDQRAWKVIDKPKSFGTRCTCGGKRSNNMSDEKILKIEELVEFR